MAEQVAKGIPTKITVLPEGRIRVTLQCEGGGTEQFLTAANAPALLVDRLVIVVSAAIANRRHVVIAYRDEFEGRPPAWVEMT
jgi:hypothetical protein